MNKVLVLGTDYETQDSIIEKAAGITSRNSVNYRKRKLQERGIFLRSFRKDGKTCYLKEDADLLINYEEGPRKPYPKNRKEPPKGTRPGKQKVKRDADP